MNWVNVPEEEHNKIKGEIRYIDVKWEISSRASFSENIALDIKEKYWSQNSGTLVVSTTYVLQSEQKKSYLNRMSFFRLQCL